MLRFVKDLSIATKIAFTCLLLVGLVAVSGLAGHNGIRQVGTALHVVGEQEAPIVDMANEMKLNLLAAQDSMRRFGAATNTVALADRSAGEQALAAFAATVAEFDSFADAILDGAELPDGSVVLATRDDALAELVRRADALHNEEFLPAATRMTAACQQLVAKVEATQSHMGDVEEASDRLIAATAEARRRLTDEVAARMQASDFTAKAAQMFAEEMPLMQALGQLALGIAETQIVIEEVVQATTVNEVRLKEAEFTAQVEAFDRWIEACLKGGTVGSLHVPATEDPALREQVAAVDALHDRFKEASGRLLAAHEDTLAQSALATQAIADLQRAGDAAAALLDQIEKKARASMSVAKVAGADAENMATSSMLLITLVAIALGLFLGLGLARVISRPVRAVVERIRDIAEGEGDLTQRLRVDRRDEVGDLAVWFNRFVGNVELLVADFRQSAEQINIGANQVSENSQTVAIGASEQAASLQEVSATLEQISAVAQQNAGRARSAAQLSDACASAADDSSAEMQQMSEAMTALESSSAEIEKVINVINEIAFQTNLLALNAAVEAARAGEAGKGFAVVADEVRNLAGRSSEAARTTSQMIETSRSRTIASVAIAGKVGKSLQTITRQSKEMNETLQAIAMASSEQAQGVEQVNLGVAELDKVIQGNASNSEELSAAAEETSAQTTHMADLVRRFKVSAVAPSVL
ncbi:MAG: methyl-accepting chemotaxis protein [Planctomycetes bacterium]|nr:methyl-accepting chemotaxis protein [Planctomycetota bacterium]